MSALDRGALSRAVARAAGSRFAKPVARAAVAVAGLVLLAVIGRSTVVASAFGAAVPGATSAVTLTSLGSPVATSDASVALPPSFVASPAPAAGVNAGALALAAPVAAVAPASVPAAAAPTATAPSSSSSAGRRASPDDPVVLNAAAVDDLRRLPGIGEKRATAILALRARLGRFHAVEDLLKVKGIGRAMLKRLRPLVRIDGPSSASVDGGS